MHKFYAGFRGKLFSSKILFDENFTWPNFFNCKNLFHQKFFRRNIFFWQITDQKFHQQIKR